MLAARTAAAVLKQPPAAVRGRGAVKVACIERPPGGMEARSRGRVLVCKAAGRGEAKSDYLPGKKSNIG